MAACELEISCWHGWDGARPDPADPWPPAAQADTSGRGLVSDHWAALVIPRPPTPSAARDCDPAASQEPAGPAGWPPPPAEPLPDAAERDPEDPFHDDWDGWERRGEAA